MRKRRCEVEEEEEVEVEEKGIVAFGGSTDVRVPNVFKYMSAGRMKNITLPVTEPVNANTNSTARQEFHHFVSKGILAPV